MIGYPYNSTTTPAAGVLREPPRPPTPSLAGSYRNDDDTEVTSTEIIEVIALVKTVFSPEHAEELEHILQFYRGNSFSPRGWARRLVDGLKRDVERMSPLSDSLRGL